MCTTTSLWAQQQSYVDFHDNGKKRSEGMYERGLEHGLWQWWTTEGQLKEASYYWFGQLHGASKTWHPNGLLQTEGYFNYGKPDSLLRTLSPDSVVLEMGHFNKGQKIGEWNYHFADGAVRLTEVYADSTMYLMHLADEKRQVQIENGNGVRQNLLR